MDELATPQPRLLGGLGSRPPRLVPAASQSLPPMPKRPVPIYKEEVASAGARGSAGGGDVPVAPAVLPIVGNPRVPTWEDLHRAERQLTCVGTTAYIAWQWRGKFTTGQGALRNREDPYPHSGHEAQVGARDFPSGAACMRDVQWDWVIMNALAVHPSEWTEVTFADVEGILKKWDCLTQKQLQQEQEFGAWALDILWTKIIVRAGILRLDKQFVPIGNKLYRHATIGLEPPQSGRQFTGDEALDFFGNH